MLMKEEHCQATGVVHKAPTSQTYAGIPIHAAPQLHERCFELVRRHVPTSAHCLDIAAGSGAFSKRLSDHGYRVQANDLDAATWQPKDIPLWTIDLNQPIPTEYLQQRFDLVAAVEVIEHLQNPVRFLNNCANFCRPGGLILLTTPNVVDAVSYCQFMINGTFAYFSPAHCHASGHITILPYWLLEEHFAAAGLEVLERHGFGDLPMTGKKKFSRTLQTVLQWLLGRHIPQELKSGACVSYLLRVGSRQ